MNILNYDICSYIFFCFFIPVVLLMIFTIITFKVVQKKYIVRRFREETNLSEMKCINAITINRFLADSWFPGIYTTHLFAIIIIGDKFFKKLPLYSDLNDRNDVLKHFSKKELTWTVIISGSGLLCFILMIIGGTLVLLNPQCRT